MFMCVPTLGFLGCLFYDTTGFKALSDSIVIGGDVLVGNSAGRLLGDVLVGR